MIRATWLHANGLDAWWGHTHALARRGAEDHFSSALHARAWSDLGEGERWLEAAREAGASSDVVFVCDAAVEPLVAEVAEEFPAVRFVHCQGRRPTENVSVYRAARDQHAFVSGMLAGAATRSGVIAAIEGMPSPHDRRFTGAWVLGARATRADVRVLVEWVGSYRAHDQDERERTAVERVRAAGADVVGGNLTENPAAVRAALEAGLRVSGHDPRDAGVLGILDCAFLDWTPFVIDVIERVRAGRAIPSDRCLRASDGVVRNSAPAADLPVAARDAVDRVSPALAAGRFDIWAGPLRDSGGRLRVADGESLAGGVTEPRDAPSARERYLDSPAFDWFPEGVIELPPLGRPLG
ncbi:BMP family ABC transporter substrate-binding protein [Microbacterium sp. 1P10AE]|uniref:BMP family ABC transporter substrate-binding protein n=1 Tax=Microbacterium sp. 1P10AE TaxID=3132286 RepID=UPI0039A028B7